MSDQIAGLMGRGSSPVSGVIPTGGGLLAGIGGLSSPKSLGALQMGTSVLSGLGTMASGQSKAASYAIQAGEWRTQARDEFVMGQNQVGGLKAQYLNDIGAMTTKAAAGGVDVGQGVVGDARTIVGGNAANAGQLAMLASDIRARRDNINAIQADAAAAEAKQAGALGLIGGVLGGGLKLLSGGVL